MNPEYERDVATETESVPAIVPEIPPTVRTAAEIKTFLEQYQHYRITLPKPTDEPTKRINQAFEACCKVASKFAESIRFDLVDPLNKRLKAINDEWQPMVKGFAALAKEVGDSVALYNYEQEQKAVAEQRRLQAAADLEKRRLEQEAETLRQHAEAQRASGNELAALKIESKADRLEMKAETVAPAITDLVPERKTDLGNGHTLSVGKVEKTWALAGWPGEKPLLCISPLLKPLIGDMEKLPPGVQFLLVNSKLDPVCLNASYKAPGAAKFPHPFTEVPKVTSSRLTQRAEKGGER